MSSKVKRLRDIPQAFIHKLMKIRYVMPHLGSDPEFFVAEKSTGKILASDKFFPDKDHPMPVNKQYVDNGKLFFDGIQAEINVPKATCREGLIYSLRYALMKATEVIGKDNTIVIKPSVKVQKSVIADAKPDARIFGCMPDFNAYTRGTNTNMVDASMHPYRYAGGHIHIGVSSPYLKPGDREHTLAKTEEGHLETIKFFDYVSGPLLVLMDKSPESKRRRSLYGAAGCFRPTPYGIEYRTPSCWWLKSPAGTSLAFGLVRLAWNILLSNEAEEFKKAVGYTEDEVRAIVNESDVAGSKKFWKAMRPYLAVAGNGNSNPLHIKSVRTLMGGYIGDNSSEWLHNVMNNKPINFDGCVGDPGIIVHALAVFDYMVRHGSDILISDDLAKEWVFSDREDHYAQNGWVNQMFYKLAKSKEFAGEMTTDFLKFQTGFLAETL